MALLDSLQSLKYVEGLRIAGNPLVKKVYTYQQIPRKIDKQQSTRSP